MPPFRGYRELSCPYLQWPRNTFNLPLVNTTRTAATGGWGRRGWTQSSWICRTDKAGPEDSGVRNPAAKRRCAPKHRAPGPTPHIPSRAAPAGHRCHPMRPHGRSLGRTIPGGDRDPRGSRRRLRPPFPAVGGGTRAPGMRRPGRPRCPRRALTQHEGAEAPGHALGQVVHIEFHGVQRQRLLHRGGGAAARRQ